MADCAGRSLSLNEDLEKEDAGNIEALVRVYVPVVIGEALLILCMPSQYYYHPEADREELTEDIFEDGPLRLLVHYHGYNVGRRSPFNNNTGSIGETWILGVLAIRTR